jgi:hypothetical protein
VVEAGGDLSHAILGELMSFLCQVARSRGGRGRQSSAGRSCHPEIGLERERRKEGILLAQEVLRELETISGRYRVPFGL